MTYLGALARETPSAANVTAYARIVREHSVQRRLLAVANRITAMVHGPDGRETADLLDEAERLVFEVAEEITRSG